MAVTAASTTAADAGSATARRRIGRLFRRALAELTRGWGEAFAMCDPLAYSLYLSAQNAADERPRA